MTSTIIFWFRMAVILLMAYTVFTFVRACRKRGYWIPKGRKDILDLLGDIFTIAAAVFVLTVLQRNYQEPIEAVMSGDKKGLSDLRYLDAATGSEKKLSDLKGRVVLLNIWATWCPPCRREMPDLDSLEHAYSGSGLTVLALSDEDMPTVSAFLREHRYRFAGGTFSMTPDMISGIGTRPVSILIDRNGEVADMVVGARGLGFFEGWIRKYLLQ